LFFMDSSHLDSFGIEKFEPKDESLLITNAKGELRAQLYGTDKAINSVACEILQGGNTWQKVKEFFGFLVRHTITLESGRKQTVLLNTSSLAKRLGITGKTLSAAATQAVAQNQNIHAVFLKKLLASQLLAERFKDDEKTFKNEMEWISGLRSAEVFTISQGEKLGEGTFGTVHQVCLKVGEVALDRFKMAQKVPRGSDNDRLQKARQDIVKEHQMLQLFNPDGEAVGIQRPHHLITHNGQVALLTSLYDGDLLKAAKASDKTKFEKRHHQAMITQLLTGLVTIHQKDLFHGDLKPENVLVKGLDTRRPLFHISDFGGVRTIEELTERFNTARGMLERAQTDEYRRKALIHSKGTASPDYDPDFKFNQQTKTPYFARGKFSDSPEYRALEADPAGNFEGWRKARQNADLHAMAQTIMNVCRPLPPTFVPILNDMKKGKVTAQQALQKFQDLWEPRA
jgi:hypothetical protein